MQFPSPVEMSFIFKNQGSINYCTSKWIKMHLLIFLKLIYPIL